MGNTRALQTVVITGANSGLGFEAAAQLAEAGYGRVVLACRSEEKAHVAREALVARVGRDPFETLVIDVSSVQSAEAAAQVLIDAGHKIDRLLLNAGMVPGDKMQKSVDGIELSLASSVIGHHVLTSRLLDAGLLDGARVVIAGSEAANGDLPAMMGMQLYDFATGEPEEFSDELGSAMQNFARGAKPELYEGTRYYAVTKLFTAWWASAMAERFGERVSVFNVSPGANLGTNAARNTTGFKRFLFTKLMPTVGPLLGMDQPVSKGARRYVDALEDEGSFDNGGTYTSKPGKMIGPVQRMTHAHILDETRRDEAWDSIVSLTGVQPRAQAAAARVHAV